MDYRQQKQAAKQFAENWAGRGYEKGETHQFWTDILQDICGMKHVSSRAKFEVHTSTGGFIDCLIPESGVIIEQKSTGIDLDKPEERQGRMVTPFEQARAYVDSFIPSQRPRFIVTCNFEKFRVYDRESHSRNDLPNNYSEFTLEELGKNPSLVNFLIDPTTSRAEKEKEASVKAGELVSKLYQKLATKYIDPESEESQHALNVLCVRLVFCLFCEDAGLFPKDAFLNYLRNVEPADMRNALKRLFAALDTPIDQRDPYDESVKPFPYVNGGLFEGEIEIPNFDQDLKTLLLLDVSQNTDWSTISPTIFGAMFESTLNPDTRHEGGMHYTSIENIHKVIDPLFLDSLRDEYEAIVTDAERTDRKKKNDLGKLHKRICEMKFLDPACGSGNFLTETYLCLRKLEDDILGFMYGGQMMAVWDMDDEESSSNQRVSLSQLYGIEVNDFAVRVAKTSLWIAQLQANNESETLLDMSIKDFPLTDSANIVLGNALTDDWNSILPAKECSYIIGNPPFNGARTMTPEQKGEVKDTAASIRNNHDLDYVAGWYVKCAGAMDVNPEICAALVSTNSICQGAQAADLWSYLINERGIAIDFAWRTFIWDNEASVKAHVHCVIVGFSKRATKPKRLFDEDESLIVCENINGYLLPAPNVFIEDRKTPLCDVPKMANGNQPRDGGNLILTEEEYASVLSKEPNLERFIRPYVGSDEFIKGKRRYCIWLEDATTEDISNSEILRERVKAVFDFRSASKAKTTNGYAKTPALFAQRPQKQGVDFLLIPMTSSERRFYLPIGYMDKNNVASNAAFVITDATLYHFGVLTSQFHNAWMRAVAGRLESRYRYSKEVVYNCFPWPECDTTQKQEIERRAKAVLDTRAKYSNAAPKDLYDPENEFLYPDLIAAHKALDAAVEEAYGVDFNGDEEKIVAHLFKLYAEAVNNE